ncbi:MAG TPA: cysteine desulfurase NifS [Chitinispirillaceae bacterium]|nr:cysteine desulfurase NifS [Chitinispirillaceae bacterium]
MSEKTIYLDNNATTQVASEVLEAMLPFFKDRYGNPSSIYRFGGNIKRFVEQAREQVAEFLGALPEEIIFTSCGSESDNLALNGFCDVHGARSKIITSTVEHPAVRNTCRFLKKKGAALVELEVDSDGMLSEDVLDGLKIDEDTIVSLMWANNETGVIFPVCEFADKVKSRGGIFHTDAVQAAGKIPINLKETSIDLLALSGHKLHAPKGIGAAFVRKGTKIEPLIHGGHQESGWRAGTENVPYIVGLGVACELARKHMVEENTRVRQMRDRLEAELMVRCAGAKLNGHKKQRLPNTTNISFEFIEGESILLHLDENGIAASSGSACTTGSLEPSHVLRAMGVPYTFAHSSTRFSLSRYTTDSDIDAVIKVMPSIVEKLRDISPFVKRVNTPDMQSQIKTLKKKEKAVILAHTYQPGEIQDIADYVGDSYGLSVQASKTKADKIIFCGVRFMAETAAVLNPSRQVILTEPKAGCPMAEMIKPEDLLKLKAQYPDYLVMCYVNSTVEIKALSDVCCTSSNAVKIARKLPQDKGIIFVPDKHLGSYVQEKTGRKMVLWNGYCPIHHQITPEMIEKARAKYPDALILIHPEAPHECRILADHVFSTGEMCEFVKSSTNTQFTIATEKGILHTLKKANPGKVFNALSDDMICPNMKKNALASVMKALDGTGGELIVIEKEIAKKAEKSLKAMLELSL